MDAETIGAYDAAARHYADHRSVRDASRAHRFAASTPVGPRLDLGCGPGLYFGLLGVPLVGCDASTAMLDVARSVEPSVVLVRADQEALPFTRRSFAGVWANKCLQHVAAPDLPMVLADLHRIFRVEGRLGAELFAGEGELRSDDDLPGRRFVLWDPEELRDLLAGAGFAVGRLEVTDRGDDLPRLLVEATRLRTLPDTVGPDMRLLVCGLNPSLVAADAGVGFAGPTNRFWKALRLAGLSEVDRDARLLLQRDGIGMTDQVKRDSCSERAPCGRLPVGRGSSGAAGGAHATRGAVRGRARGSACGGRPLGSAGMATRHGMGRAGLRHAVHERPQRGNLAGRVGHPPRGRGTRSLTAPTRSISTPDRHL